MLRIFKLLADNSITLKAEYVNTELIVTLTKGDYQTAFKIDENFSENDFYWEYLEPAISSLKKVKV